LPDAIQPYTREWYAVAMTQEQRQLEDKRGLRFPFEADAQVVLPSASDKIPARVTELSFRGCFLEISSALQEKQRLRVKIFHSDEFFESSAEVIYVRPTGVGLVFGNLEPPFRKVLQAWILTALDAQAKSKRP
jgi:hypothetical protein